MEVLQKYITELEIDVKLDELNLKESALTLPAKKAKWVSRLMIEKKNLNDLLASRSIHIKTIVNQIKNESPIKLTGPSLERAAEQHESIKKIDNSIELQKHVVDFLERVERTIHSIGFDIKNLIELIKMETA
jgi:hypothetical protein